jgi:hypothetical protein
LIPPKLNRGSVKGALLFGVVMLLSAWGATLIHEVLGHAAVGYLMGVPIERIELVPQLQLRGINVGFIQFVEFGPGVDLTEPRYWPIVVAGFLAEAGMGLVLVALTVRTRLWIYFAAWVNFAFISSGSDFILLAMQRGIPPSYYLLINMSLFLTGFILCLPWYLLAEGQRKRCVLNTP